VYVRAFHEQVRGSRELADIAAAPRPAPEPSAPSAPTPPEDGSPLARIEIPRLKLSAIVFEGTTTDVLDIGVGHLVSSAVPGNGGNVVLSAHRDTFFRALRDVRIGDTVTISSPTLRTRYIVESTSIVEPNDISVIQPTSDSRLTLITCYPFRFIGKAPKRFIVNARALESGSLAL
jgi:sortase A